MKKHFLHFFSSICISASRICILFRRGISFFKDCISTLFSVVQFFNYLAHSNDKPPHTSVFGLKLNQVLMNCSKFNLVGPLLIKYSFWIRKLCLIFRVQLHFPAHRPILRLLQHHHPHCYYASALLHPLASAVVIKKSCTLPERLFKRT